MFLVWHLPISVGDYVISTKVKYRKHFVRSGFLYAPRYEQWERVLPSIEKVDKKVRKRCNRCGCYDYLHDDSFCKLCIAYLSK